jgi:hypothetical protein
MALFVGFGPFWHDELLPQPQPRSQTGNIDFQKPPSDPAIWSSMMVLISLIPGGSVVASPEA